MNNKGTTIVEVLVSIVLMSIVLIFLMALLSDLKNEDYLSNTRSKDALNRIEIIHLIETDMIDYGVNKITISNCSNNLCIRFDYKNNSNKQLKITNKEVIYDDEKWTLNSGNYQLNQITYYNYSNSYYHLFKMSIPATHDASSYRKLSLDLSYFDSSFDVVGVGTVIS